MVGDICSFCRPEGRVVSAVLACSIDLVLLPNANLLLEGQLLDGDRIYCCTEHISSMERVLRAGICDAFGRVESAVESVKAGRA